MSSKDPNLHISEIRTRWSKILQPDHEILRYYGPVYRYLLGITRDPAAAEELANEFAVRFLEGKFKHADPKAGRLRDLIKKVVRNLAIDYLRKTRTEKQTAMPWREANR